MSRARGAIGLGALLCLVAGAFAATPLFVPGLAALIVCAVAAVWVTVAARGATVARAIDPQAVEEGGSVRLRIAVTCSRVPLPGAELRAWDGGPAVSRTDAAGRDAHGVTTTMRFERRGRHRVPPASLEIADPLGLWRRTALSVADEVLVLPRVEPVERFRYGGRASRSHGAGAGAGSADAGATDLDTLQPYRPGTPASRIHWPTVARTATLMERRLVADDDRLPLVVVDPRAPSSADALDRAVRATASLCVDLARRGGCGLLLPGDRRPVVLDEQLSGFAAAHARLAVLDPEAGGPSTGIVAGADTVLWVTAAAAPAGLPGSVAYVITPHPEPRWPVHFAVAGCRGYALGHSAAEAVAV